MPTVFVAYGILLKGVRLKKVFMFIFENFKKRGKVFFWTVAKLKGFEV